MDGFPTEHINARMDKIMCFNFDKNKKRISSTLVAVALGLLPLFAPFIVHGQQFDLLIKNGRVIDPKNQIDSKLDVAVKDGKIAKVGKDIPSAQVKKVIDASGLLVTPGLIDIHTHVFVGSKPDTFSDGFSIVSPDDFTFRSGVTAVVDAGTSGWRNFSVFKDHVIDKSQTRVLAFLNISGTGMSGNPEQQDVNDMDAHMTSLAIKKYPDIIVGVKIGHFEGMEWTPFDRALEAARLSDVPLFVECHLPQLPLQEQLGKMRPGDIITHSFEKVSERMPVVDEQGALRPFVLEARNRGVLFDVGHGGVGFWFCFGLPGL